jgi:hypothetical protein
MHVMNDRLKRVKYVNEMIATLAVMARQDGHTLLAYLLEMAMLEARERADGLSQKATSLHH